MDINKTIGPFIQPPKGSDLTKAMDAAFAGIVSSNDTLRGSVAMNIIDPTTVGKNKNKASELIQKRGTSLPGDIGNNYGLHGYGPLGLHGLTAPLHYSPFYGRGPTTFGPFNTSTGYPGFFGGHSPLSLDVSGSHAAISDTSRVAHNKMFMTTQAYKGFGVIKNVIDLMCNFASEGITIQHPRPAIRKFYQRWAEHVNLPGRIKDILRYYYKYGNVFIYTSMGSIDNSAYDRMKTARGDTTDPSHDEKLSEIDEQKEMPVGQRLIPWRYILLNPFQMDLRGTKFFGEQQWVFVLDETTLNEIKTKSDLSSKEQTVTPKLKKSKWIDFLDESDINLPPEFKQLTKKGRVVQLDQGKLWTMHYMKDDHEDWADPMIWPVMSDIFYKNKLRAMDISTCDSVINAITLFKLGRLEEGFVAPQAHYDKLAEMLRTPSASLNLIWNDAIEMESNYPPVDKILGVQKYEAVDRDILAGLGVSEVIINGRGGNYANSFLSVRTLLERLEEGRREVEKWVTQQLRMIAAIMGHRDIPSIKFGQMSLRDEKAEKQIILGLLDRNVISVEAAHEALDFDFKIEVERLKQEKEIQDNEEILIRHGPFKDPFSDMQESEIMDREDERIDKQAQIKMREKRADRNAQRRLQQRGPNGRPPGSDGIPQNKKRDTKPQGMAFIKDFMNVRIFAFDIYKRTEDVIFSRILENRGVKYKKSLSKEDKENIDRLVMSTFSNMDIYEDCSVNDVLASAGPPNPSYLSCLDELTKNFVEKMQREPNAKEIREIRVNAKVLYEIGD